MWLVRMIASRVNPRLASGIPFPSNSDKLNAMPLDPRLLDILCCPACHGELLEKPEGLHCQVCGLLYPIEDGIPVMLIDHAKQVAL